MNKYEIICYGDSNTHGTVARWNVNEPGIRFDRNTRWPCVLQKELGEDYFVVEEGLPFRTTIYTENPEKQYLNGKNMLEGVLQTHKPVDLVILMLGTNDIKLTQKLTSEEQGKGIEILSKIVIDGTDIGRDGNAPDVLIVAPAALTKPDANGRTEVYDCFHGEYGIEQSKIMPQVYKNVADKLGCFYLNSQDYVTTDPGDGVHITEESHVMLGKALARMVERISKRN